MYELFVWNDPVLIWISISTLVLLIVTGPIFVLKLKTLQLNGKVAIEAVVILGSLS